MKANKRFMIVGIAVIFSVLLFSRQSFGWGNTWLGINLKQIVDAARGKLGPLRYNASFGLGNTGYNSDVYYGRTQDPVPDYTFAAGPQLSLFLPLRNGIVFEISENPQYMFYLHTKRYRALNNAFRGQVHFAFKRLYFKVGGGLTNAKQRLTNEVFINVRRKVNDLMGLAFWQISKLSALQLQYRSSTYEIEIPTDASFNWGALNRKNNYITLTAYIQELKRMRFFLEAEYGSFVFRETISSRKDSRSYGINGGIEFVSSLADRGIQGQINLGYKRFDVLDLQRIDYGGLVGNTSVSINIFKFTSFRGIFSRNIQFSVYSGINYYIQTIFGIGVNHEITQKISFSYDFSFSRNDYVPGEESGLEEARRRFINHNYRLGFRLRENLELNLIVTIGERARDWTAQIYRYQFIGFNLTYSII